MKEFKVWVIIEEYDTKNETYEDVSTESVATFEKYKNAKELFDELINTPVNNN